MTVSIVPWGEDDLPLLEGLLGDPAMMEHLGGPESPEKIAERQQRYLKTPGQFKVLEDAEGIGWVGYWERYWREQEVYEIGWFVLPAFQGRGIAQAATAQVLERARAEGARRDVHAFPSVDNTPSNAICRKLGFALLEALDFEYPADSGHVMRCNDWRLDLVRSTTP